MRLRDTNSSWLSRTFNSLNNKDFRMLWIGLFLSMAGFNMQMVIRGVLVYDLTDDPILTGLVGMGFAPSLLVVSLFGGVISDLVDRRLIIQISQAANAILAAIVAFLVFFELIHWSHLFIVAVFQGAGFALQLPARQAAIPSLVGEIRITNAIALIAIAMSVTSLACPGIGGFLYEFISPSGAYICVTILMVLAVFFTSLVKSLKPTKNINRDSMIKNIGDGLNYIYQTRLLRIVIIHMIVLALLSMPFRMLVQVFAKDVYGSDPSSVGILLAAAGLGGLFGSIFIAGLSKGNNRGLVFLLSGIFSALAMIIASLFPFYFIGVISLILVGVGESGRWALGQALMMEISDDAYKARVMSVIMMSFGLMPLGMLPMGWAIESYGSEFAVGIFGLVLMIFTISYLLFARSIKNYK